MGNCQAAEVATVVIHHPGAAKVERIYWSVSADEIMNSNPGHYVAQVVAPPAKTDNAASANQLRLLRPDDTLVIGQVYRLISFEDVLKVFAAKKSVKLGRLLKERKPTSSSQSASIKEMHHLANSCSGGSRGGGKFHGGGGQWRPALQSISELGS